MTVEFVPARPHFGDAPSKRLRLPGDLATPPTYATLLACAIVACATTACGDRTGDARVALTTSAARELGQTQPAASTNPQPNPAQADSPLATTFAAGASTPNSADGANSAAALAARAVRSPARPGAAAGEHAATDADNAPLATPVIHTAD
ncbi:hypothetical protein ACFSHT_15290 [Paraburkholderia silviterrae]|uniref:Uncharacterized protein n=1 Tax=Paraburkholderia silviterrae TaxID=2528715 RepID=A0A4R5M9M2_9BURK|nr:hypothetical protein [Paraburkholderia silviterrae]TDG23329.1 hypothetical protein EYW47_15520 [Paraburkholderia silviterrae]